MMESVFTYDAYFIFFIKHITMRVKAGAVVLQFPTSFASSASLASFVTCITVRNRVGTERALMIISQMGIVITDETLSSVVFIVNDTIFNFSLHSTYLS